MRGRVLALLLALALCAPGSFAGTPQIKPIERKIKLEGKPIQIQLEAQPDSKAIHRWSIGRNPLFNATVDRQSGLLSISANPAAAEFDASMPASVRTLTIRCKDENTDKSAVKEFEIEVAMDLRLPRYGALPAAPSNEVVKNVRRLSLDTFLLGRPDAKGNVAPNAVMYQASLYAIAKGMQGRANEAWQAYPVDGELLDDSGHATYIEQKLQEIVAIFESDPNHPLKGVPLWQYYTVDQSVEPTGDPALQAKREEVFSILYLLQQKGIEMPFTGCVDRMMARWLFNDCGLNCNESDFIKDNAKGIGWMVEHHYYTLAKEDYPVRAWYVAIAREAGILKSWWERNTPPDYSEDKCGPVPAGLNPPLAAPAYDCGLNLYAYAYEGQDSSKDNGMCCNPPQGCIYVPEHFCSIFEGDCSISSDPCPPTNQGETAQASK